MYFWRVSCESLHFSLSSYIVFTSQAIFHNKLLSEIHNFVPCLRTAEYLSFISPFVEFEVWCACLQFDKEDSRLLLKDILDINNDARGTINSHHPVHPPQLYWLSSCPLLQVLSLILLLIQPWQQFHDWGLFYSSWGGVNNDNVVSLDYEFTLITSLTMILAPSFADSAIWDLPSMISR